jgi:hypothetical protein
MSDLLQHSPSMGSSLYAGESSGPVELVPNPDFVFPARSPESPVSPSISGWASLHQQRRSEQILAPAFASLARHSQSALPDFVFNPSTSATASPLSTPPQSPLLAGPPTPRARHRRGGSEFIGRDRAGGVNVVNSSPEKPDASLQRPLHLGPPPGRRHVHRRSGAVSLQDLTSVLQPRDPNLQNRSGSAPTTPLETEKQPIFGFEQVLSGQADAAYASDASESPQKRPPSRARVGFADRVEYIRPLSIISSETESSMSTIRGHSVTNSFSSVVSGTPSVRMTRPSLDTVVDTQVLRPHTSHVSQPSPRRASLPEVGLTERPRSSSCSSDTSESEIRSKKKGFHWWDSKHKSLQPVIPKSYDGRVRSKSPPPRSPLARSSLESDQETIKDGQPASRKPRKVRSWAHSLISRKGKSKEDHRVPTPKMSQDSLATSDSGSSSQAAEIDFEPNFDEDNTVILVDEHTAPVTEKPTLNLAIKPSLSPKPDLMSPVIDLDAALGPFNTPPLASNARGMRMPPRARRSMHSLVGSQVHRRTESAPELVPFDPRNLALLSTTAMPDVFEEDGEEELADDPETPRESFTGDSVDDTDTEPDTTDFEGGTGVHVVEYDENSSSANPFRRSITGFGSSRRKKSEGLSISIDSPVLTQEQTFARERRSIEVVDAHEEQRQSKASDETLTPPMSASKDSLAPYSMPLQQHIMTPDTLSDSCGSPYFSASQVSFDTPRLGTGTSSMTDCHQAFMGEPGPEIRVSVDDVPSLTSSRSTMTSPMVVPHGPSNLSNVHAASDLLPPPKTSDSELDGSAPSVYSLRSTNALDFGRKRSSIASLSRLIAAPFAGERTRNMHSTEVMRPHSQHVNASMVSLTNTSGKTKKRLSKLVMFWKGGKEKEKEMRRPATSSLAMSTSY